ncbi:MAG: carboxypeptidase regulatory-like domain-containing protein [Bacteroidaceae bacterium]|nr:carboxypeptidase regulatory-like domain-containing protein [Bacteroidaceae bacterium]
MKKIFYVFPLLAALFFTGCEVELPNLMGGIYGIVSDSQTGEPISNAQVMLSPGNRTTVTGYDGHFEFKDLEPMQYKLQVSANGYNTNSKQITVMAGYQVSGDMILTTTEKESSAQLSNDNFNFGSTITEQVLTIKNTGNNGTISWEITGVDVAWLKVSPLSGTIAEGKEVAVKLVVDHNKLATDEASTTFMVNAAEGSQSVRVSINKPTVTGIKGIVKDALDGHLIQNCSVRLTPTNALQTTDENGNFKFTALGAGEYTLTFEKVGYPTKSETVVISTGEVKDIVVLMKPSTPFSSTRETLDFGNTETTMTFELINASDGMYSFTTSNVPSWLNLSHTSGTLQMSSQLTITATLDRNKVNYGSYSQDIRINYSGRAQGEIVLTVKFVKTETVSNATKWDGTIAKSFAGGSGTKGDPYIIKNGGQLMLMKNYTSSYFEIKSDIDLNNKNWLPIDNFSGTLKGNNHTIYNLRIERDECEYRGLIGKLNGGSISNLTIRGVKIYGDYSGTFVGYMYGGQITNCHVILENDSELKSGDYIGGIAGYSDYWGGENYIINCSVKSAVQDDKYRINGTQCVGGIIGDCSATTIESCQVVCNVIGEQCVGGIIGCLYRNSSATNSLYQGNISGSKDVGGICGDSNSTNFVIGCKTVANIECDGNYVGGIAGGGNVIACYAEGTITCNNSSASDVSGITNDGATLSYSAMQCTHAKFCPTSSYSYGIEYSYSIYGDETNVAGAFDDSYSEYLEYWNTSNCWTWKGTINGESKQIKFPRLAWE